MIPNESGAGHPVSTARKINKNDSKKGDERLSFKDHLRNFDKESIQNFKGEIENKSQRLFVEKSKPIKSPFDHVNYWLKIKKSIIVKIINFKKTY